MSSAKKLYCYVDESGQDARSNFFVVASIVSGENQEKLRANLLEIEMESGVGRKKWYKSRSPERENFLGLVLARDVATGSLYYGCYKKPTEFFLPVVETLSRAIQYSAQRDYRCIIYVDGIDRHTAQELTKNLRLRGIKADYVRRARDESEPIIRLTDRWVGCIRASLEGSTENRRLAETALHKKYMRQL